MIQNNDKIEFNKCDLSKPITLKEFKKATGLSKKQVKKSLDELLEKGFIKVFAETKKGTLYLLNYNIQGA
ncbi:hypothetical protein FJR45_00385 [Sulfurimonas sediminis]|uniref:MarR family transcriptional regulator n=1 Tax=Sulfurimonas sediminis TaxID=2590020 RepID=A0A7M1AYF9_9BACT|nr:hypothetical protein [Sulfurimonas sediminis]QOP42493.1 hypothetical protein FJR45_00385 [Sulfurimonas sediminis]